ncbi:DgyrCDS14460 [Dimorphilus gyrociliatus]|uniref:DgyrCDS14460 n=1 Tax=Dimorphilus gyrociliatus TaxID=2664684 RepID=A0A7I8WDP9_9ANNE|nr:DgyrCDS14460 [Dimorphilus gyrociliatus]
MYCYGMPITLNDVKITSNMSTTYARQLLSLVCNNMNYEKYNVNAYSNKDFSAKKAQIIFYKEEEHELHYIHQLTNLNFLFYIKCSLLNATYYYTFIEDDGATSDVVVPIYGRFNDISKPYCLFRNKSVKHCSNIVKFSKRFIRNEDNMDIIDFNWTTTPECLTNFCQISNNPTIKWLKKFPSFDGLVPFTKPNDIDMLILQTFMGRLQVEYDGYWYNVSGFDIDANEVRVICQYFNFNSGTINRQSKNRMSDSFIFSLDCLRNVTNLNLCNVTNFMKLWLDEITGLDIVCSKQFIQCDNDDNSPNSKIGNYLNSCYYLYKVNATLSHNQGKSFCNVKGKNLIGVSSQDEARFIENALISLHFRNSSEMSIKKLMAFSNQWKIPNGLKREKQTNKLFHIFLILLRCILEPNEPKPEFYKEPCTYLRKYEEFANYNQLISIPCEQEMFDYIVCEEKTGKLYGSVRENVSRTFLISWYIFSLSYVKELNNTSKKPT